MEMYGKSIGLWEDRERYLSMDGECATVRAGVYFPKIYLSSVVVPVARNKNDSQLELGSKIELCTNKPMRCSCESDFDVKCRNCTLVLFQTMPQVGFFVQKPPTIAFACGNVRVEDARMLLECQE